MRVYHPETFDPLWTNVHPSWRHKGVREFLSGPCGLSADMTEMFITRSRQKQIDAVTDACEWHGVDRLVNLPSWRGTAQY